MPWFCYPTASKKRSTKSKKSKRKSGRKEIERCQKYVVIVKDYVAATADEVSVHRGQVVEMVCTKGNWVYIHGNNSSTGYVPKDYTLEVDKSDGNLTNINLTNGITSIENGNIAGPAPSTRSINVGTLHHSGSSVTSVEVHQLSNNLVGEFRDSGEGEAMPPVVSQAMLGSSQAIYEVPRCPDGAAAANLNSDESGMAPALPPRSACLPTAAEIQQSLSSYRTTGTTPYHHRNPTQRNRPGNLALPSTASHPCPYHRPRYQYGPFPPNTADNLPPRCTCLMLSTNPGTHSSVAPSRHLPPIATPGSLNGSQGPMTPGYSPPVWTPPHGAGRRVVGSSNNSPLSQHRHMSRQQMPTTPGVPQTPGSAGLPSATPASPVVSNFALTPPRTHDCCRDLAESLPTMGNGIRVSSSSSSSYSSYGRRAMARPQRSRRYSSDLQVHSTISENIAGSSQQEIPSGYKDYPRRQSQPCLVANSALTRTTNTERREDGYLPQQRPTLLPVRRSLSMHEPFSGRQPLGGRNSCPCTPQQYSQQPQLGGVDGQMQRAVSCMEAVRDGKVFNATPTAASRKPVEVATTPQRTLPAGAANARRRRSRSSSNRLDSVPSIEEGVETTAPTPDDVFLPETRNKPVGIFRCTKTCTPKFKGEIMLQENEMVIVLDYGKGQWAWVMTSNNSEGLVSKTVLARYQLNGIGTNNNSPTAVTADSMVFDDSDSGRGTITKHKGVGFRAQAGSINVCVDASTQTSQAMDAALHTTPRSASVGVSTGYSTSSVPTNESSPLSTSQRAETGQVRTKRKRRGGGDQKEVKDENMVLLEAAATAVAKHAKLQSKSHPQPPPKEWFNTIDSLDERERVKPYVDSTAGSRLPSSSQLLESSSTPTVIQQPKASAAEVENVSRNETERLKKKGLERTHENGIEKSQSESPRSARGKERRGNSAAPLNSALSPARPGAKPAEHSKPATNHVLTTKEVVKPGTIHYHDRISGMGSVNFNSKSQTELSDSPPKLGRQRSRPQIGLSNVLTAVKDYTPTPNSKNCIAIKEGDVLHLQTHMHYPKGWMWVWHTSRRSFGYVPKNYVAYTYETVRRGRPRINTVEDAV